MMNMLFKDHLVATTPCPDRDQLLCYLLGKLPDDTSEQIAAHLDECPTCESAIAARGRAACSRYLGSG